MVLVGFLAMLVGCALAWLLGGRAERLGAAALAGCWLVSILFQAIMGLHDDVPILVADVLYAVALVALASRFDRSWIWVSLVLQSAVLIGHGLVLVLQGQDRMASVAFINVASFGTLLTLVLGAGLYAVGPRRRGRRRHVVGTRRPSV